MAKNFGSLSGSGLLSGKVKLDYNNLDSDRREYLSLDQAEPNLGLPAQDGQVLVSNTDGTRTFTSSLALEGLSFKAAGLDSAGPNDFYALVVKGNPFDSVADSIGVRRLDDSIFDFDTLQTVTQRGDSTDIAVSVGGLTSTGKVFLKNVDFRSTSLSLYLDPTTGEVVATTPETEATTALLATKSTDSDATYYPIFRETLAGVDSNYTDVNYTYNPNQNKLTLGRLNLNQLPNFPTSDNILVINDSSDVGFRTLGGLALRDSEQDTLQTVTQRGDSTDRAVTVQSLTAVDSVRAKGRLVADGGLYDGSQRQLIIYDSAGAILWG